MISKEISVSIIPVVKIFLVGIFFSIVAIFLLSYHYEIKTKQATSQWGMYSECSHRFSTLAILAIDYQDTERDRARVQWNSALSDFNSFLTTNMQGTFQREIKNVLDLLEHSSKKLMLVPETNNQTEKERLILKREFISVNITLLLQEGLLLSQKKERESYSVLARLQTESRNDQNLAFIALLILVVIFPASLLALFTGTFTRLLQMIESVSNNPTKRTSALNLTSSPKLFTISEIKRLNNSFEKMAENVILSFDKYQNSQNRLSREIQRFHTVTDAIDAIVYVSDLTTNEILFANKKCMEITGNYTGKKCWEVMQTGQTGPCSSCNNPLLVDGFGRSTGLVIWEVENSKNGHWYECRNEAIEWTDGRMVRLEMAYDITQKKDDEKERIKLENRLQHGQKMEAIGVLAGGIAHDFNNILSVIFGYVELAKEDCQLDSTISDDLDKVLEAANRAKDLVQQILAFSRQEDVARKTVQPASIVKETIKMLRPSLPTTINIDHNLAPKTGYIFADPTQIHQILMNLCTNAFHAMESTGGNLDISLKEVVLGSEDLVHETDVAEGAFIQLSISDSGPGIEPAIKNKIFDPYFTTKETGKGTGMGLSMVHGIVKSYGGFISLYSELGEGTVFHVFLPVVKTEEVPEDEIIEHIPLGKERILFVDDEATLAKMGQTILERLGYHVTLRNSSVEALETFRNQPDQFDLVITDQTMPNMTGSELSRRILEIRPDISIILCTGYSTIISEEKAKSIGIKEFALKPLTREDIAKLIRKVLGNNQA